MADTNYNLYFLKKFNNYFNRKVIGFSTLAEYINAAEDYFVSENPVSFDPKDNVSTEIVMNNCPFDADYCILTDLEGNILSRWFVMEVVFIRRGQKTYKFRRDVIYDYLDELMMSPVFVQKGWLKDSDPFIFNPEGMSFNQIKSKEILLKDKSKSAWIVGYVAKNAAGSDVSVQIAPETIKAYVNLSDIATELGITESKLASLMNIGSGTSIPAYITKRIEIRYGWSTSDPIPFVAKQQLFFSGDFSEYSWGFGLVASWNKTLYKLKYPFLGSIDKDTLPRNAIISSIIANKSSIVSDMPSILNRSAYLTQKDLEILNKYKGQIIYYSGNYYTFNIQTSGQSETIIGPAVYSSFLNISTAINNAVSTSQFTNNATFHSDGEISVRSTDDLVYFQLIETAPEIYIPKLKTKISSSRNKIQTQNFDMFCIPLNKVFIYGSGYSFDSVDNENPLRITMEIARELDSSCYDIQLLPYCPIPELITVDNRIDLYKLTENEDFNYIDAENTLIRILNKQGLGWTDGVESGGYYHYTGDITGTPLWPDNNGDVVSLEFVSSEHDIENLSLSYDHINKKIDFSFDATYYSGDPQAPVIAIYINFIYRGTDRQSVILWAKKNSFQAIIDTTLISNNSAKIESECNKYRFCSPNYQGSFDFNLAKNGMSVEYFIADCTYKPYTPYIKVSPAFKGLYGNNYGDCRGLICSGDFSLPRLSDAWESYELQNKNYQNIFNREIQNLDFEQSLEYRKALLTGGLGVITGGGAGAVAGGMLGGGWGALGGAVVGSTGSAIGLGIDIDMLVKQQRENKQLAIDKFNYQLGNIKALPYTLTKIGAFNINSKIWPFVEYYTCTEEEREALENKLKYESMTVMRINYFGDFWRVDSQLRYFKGELIRNEEIAEDNHIFEAIYTELAKGVYM